MCRLATFRSMRCRRVYVANILVEEVESQIASTAVPACELDLDYLERVGVADRLPRWRELAARQVEQTR